MTDEFSEYFSSLLEAADNSNLRIGLNRAILSYRRGFNEALSRHPHTIELAKKVRKIKEESIARLDELVKQTMDSIEDSKGNVYLAENAEKAREIIGDIVGSNKLVVKSKTLTSEEIALNPYLESLGNEVVETDLGEFIVQLASSKPMHFIVPALHIPREKVAEIFKKKLGVEVGEEVGELVKTARKYLREKYFAADVGISGANVVAADTGSIFVIENEGNARFVTNAPPVHIALVGIEKVVPSLSDAMSVCEVTFRYAGFRVPTYISIIFGPSKTGDIEYEIAYGAHGPKEFHVILLDNGRSKMSKHPIFKEALYCLRCGGCLIECPVFQIVAGNFGYRYFGGIGTVWTAFTESLKTAAHPAFSCTLCGKCKAVCPMEIDVPNMILELRRKYARKKLLPPELLAAEKIILEGKSPYRRGD